MRLHRAPHKRVRKGTSGLCPELGYEKDVEVDFIEIPVLDSRGIAYRKYNLYCDNLSDCQTANGKEFNCPLYRACSDPS